MGRIVTPETLATERDRMDRAGQRLVFTNGCFDILHLGHVRYLQAARAMGDALAVALNADLSVRALKGPLRPINHETARAEVLAALAAVDYVTLFEQPRIDDLVRVVRPHLYVKGGDYTAASLDPQEKAALESVGAKIEILPLVPGQSTTGLLRRLDSTHPPLRLGIIGSGKGSNFAAVLEAIRKGDLAAEVRVVVSDAEDAGILEKARAAGIPALYLPPGRYRTKLEPEAERRLVSILREHGAEWVLLAGYMRMVKAPMLEAFPRRIVNIHPALLPRFPGLEAWKQALDAGVPETGCTVHYVDAGMDTGPVIAQRTVPVLPGDTPQSLHARIQIAEHELLPAVLRRIASGEGGTAGNTH